MRRNQRVGCRASRPRWSPRRPTTLVRIGLGLGGRRSLTPHSRCRIRIRDLDIGARIVEAMLGLAHRGWKRCPRGRRPSAGSRRQSTSCCTIRTSAMAIASEAQLVDQTGGTALRWHDLEAEGLRVGWSATGRRPDPRLLIVRDTPETTGWSRSSRDRQTHVRPIRRGVVVPHVAARAVACPALIWAQSPAPMSRSGPSTPTSVKTDRRFGDMEGSR